MKDDTPTPQYNYLTSGCILCIHVRYLYTRTLNHVVYLTIELLFRWHEHIIVIQQQLVYLYLRVTTKYNIDTCTK